MFTLVLHHRIASHEHDADRNNPKQTDRVKDVHSADEAKNVKKDDGSRRNVLSEVHVIRVVVAHDSVLQRAGGESERQQNVGKVLRESTRNASKNISGTQFIFFTQVKSRIG